MWRSSASGMCFKTSGPMHHMHVLSEYYWYQGEFWTCRCNATQLGAACSTFSHGIRPPTNVRRTTCCSSFTRAGPACFSGESTLNQGYFTHQIKRFVWVKVRPPIFQPQLHAITAITVSAAQATTPVLSLSPFAMPLYPIRRNVSDYLHNRSHTSRRGANEVRHMTRFIALMHTVWD